MLSKQEVSDGTMVKLLFCYQGWSHKNNLASCMGGVGLSELILQDRIVESPMHLDTLLNVLRT